MFMYVFCVNLLFLETARLYIYSPLRIQEIGLGDGEVMEKLWSFLQCFFRMTKEMHPAHQTDVLFHALAYYCTHNIE